MSVCVCVCSQGQVAGYKDRNGSIVLLFWHQVVGPSEKETYSLTVGFRPTSRQSVDGQVGSYDLRPLRLV